MPAKSTSASAKSAKPKKPRATSTGTPKKAKSKKVASVGAETFPLMEEGAGDEKPSKGRGRKPGTGPQLVIVESPAKAKTINKYLGSDFVVHASVGHIRDLPAKSEKGAKQPVPGVDLEHDFKPTYVVLPGKTKTVAELKRLAKDASEVWFATDLDREGEAIAWHLAEVLGIRSSQAKRVVFNAITKAEVQKAFANPRPIDDYKVSAQQARRILDRIVGYQASPLLWKKVTRGLSAGRVQSVAVRLIVEREREIRAFVPDEYWEVDARLTLDASRVPELAKGFAALLAKADDKGKGPTVKQQYEWLTKHEAVVAELVELGGKKFALGCSAAEVKDLSKEVERVCDAVGLMKAQVTTREQPEGKGPAKFVRKVSGEVDPAARYDIESIETKQTSTRPPGPFITSSLQIAAANVLGFSAQRTMRTAQALYEGVNVPGEGQVGLITYMRTDSTHLSGEAIGQARDYIAKYIGPGYLPDGPNFFGSANKNAQEAHEAIRPTGAVRTPESLQGALSDDQLKLYRLIWSRFIACQMLSAKWDVTNIRFARKDKATGAVLKASGRTLAFDGFYRVAGVPSASDEQTLPPLKEKQTLAPFTINPVQKFTSPPPRYSEASLVKTLESEGIGRPSTYASIISVIQDRKYVEQLERRFYATDLGEVVTDKLTEAFPGLMDVGYTRQMEAQLDQIEDNHTDWVAMLHQFYSPFTKELEHALGAMTHAKAELELAPYKCPKCGARTAYRFGKNGRFLSCTRYPECDYGAPIDRDNRPLIPERVNVKCPLDGSPMELRTGRFGQYLASINYPAVEYVVNVDPKGGIKLPSPKAFVTDVPCSKCKSPMNLRRGKRGPWLGCTNFPKCRGRVSWASLDAETQARLVSQLEVHEAANPVPVLTTLDGKPIAEGTPVSQLVLPSQVAPLEIHPEALAIA